MPARMTLCGVALWLTALLLGCSGRASPSNDAGAADGSSGSPGDADVMSPCGEENQPCCGNQCNPDLNCVSDFLDSRPPHCRRCGGNDEPCCPLPRSCNAGLVCWLTSDKGDHCGPPLDAGPDVACITSCTQAGGQYCGYIGTGCGCGFLNCGKCANPDFTCGGAGISSVCGARRDSGACEVTICDAPSGRYCGVIGDGCGGALDCGPCPNAQICGELVPNVCGSPAQSLPQPPPPRDPPPPAPPPRPRPICPELP